MQLRDTYLPEYLELFDYTEKDKSLVASRKTVGLKDFYLHYASDRAKEGKAVEFTFSEFKEFCSIYNEYLAQEICREGTWIKLPFGMGLIGISKFTPRYYKPRFKKEGVELYTNPHSEGFVAKFSWDKEKAMLTNKTLWRHVAPSSLRQNIAKAIFNYDAAGKYHILDRESEKLTRQAFRKEKKQKEMNERAEKLNLKQGKTKA
jgi:hypothetical protein